MSARRNTRRTKLTTQVAGCFYFQIRTRCERLATQLLRWKYFYFCRELRRRNPSHHADPSWIERSRNKPERILSLKRYLKPSDSRRLIVARVPSSFSFLSFFFSSFFLSSSHRIGAVDKKYEEIEVVAVFYYACTSDFFRQLGCLPNVEKLKRPRASKQDRNRVEYLGRVDNSTAVKLDLSRFYGETLFCIVSCISENHRLILLRTSIVHCNVVTIRQCRIPRPVCCATERRSRIRGYR